MRKAIADMILGGLALAFLWACFRFREEQKQEAEMRGLKSSARRALEIPAVWRNGDN